MTAPERAALPLPMDLAPTDGTMLRLLVQFDGCGFEDSDEPCWTIGFNNLGNTGEDRWQFAGWNWTQDCIMESPDGKPIGWLPLHDTPPSVPAERAIQLEQALKDILTLVNGEDGLIMRSVRRVANQTLARLDGAMS